DTAHPAENPLPTLRKNTAHKADANLLKHTDRSSTLRYLRTVGSLTLSLRAIEAMDSPFLRRERIDCIWGMLIIAFPDLSRMELEAPSG
ncbi:hypothetical protein, partial [Bifidobacterium longum]|uniref:hypothetical protein n=1 Tax=Bifidobacterium longum TaxID=216816 RepID=UPI000516BE41